MERKTIPTYYLNFKTLLDDIILNDHLTDIQKTILQTLNNYFNLKLNVYSDDEISHLKEILPNCEYINDVQWLFNLVDIRDLFYLKNYILEQKSPDTTDTIYLGERLLIESFMYKTFKKNLFLSLCEENSKAIKKKKYFSRKD